MRKGTLWILLGILLMAVSLVLTLHNLYEDYSAGEHSESVLLEMNCLTADSEVPDSAYDVQPVPKEPLSLPEELPAFALHPAVEMPTVLIDDYRYIGIISFPEMNIEFPVMEEWDYTRLKIAPCLFSGSIYMNDAVICGHNYQSHFAPLNNADIGFHAVFTDVDGNKFTYALNNIDIIQPNDVEEMTVSNGDWDLTVFTCTAGGKSRTSLRFKLIEVEYSKRTSR